MKGFGRHLAASIAITAVFIVCAVAIGVTAGPAAIPNSVAGKTAAPDVSVPVSVVEVADAAPEAAPQVVSDAAVKAPQAVEPAPEQLEAAPAQSDPVSEVAPLDPVSPQPAAPKKPLPALNPPKDLVGTFLPGDTPCVSLTWDPNNTKRIVEYFNVYRLVVGEPEQGNVPPIAKTKKPAYKDSDIEPGLTYRYWVTAVSKDSKGDEESGASNLVDVKTYDNKPPATPQGVQAWAIDPGVSFDWLPNTDGNLAGYNVYEPIGDSHNWRKLNSQPLLDNHYYYNGGVAGVTYAVSAVNFGGIESEYAKVTAVASPAVVYEENDPSISVEGLWVTETYVGPTNGKIRVAGDAGAKMHFHFKGSQVKMTVAKYWTCGNANIYIDGVLVATISLYSYSTTFGVVQINLPGLERGEHVLTMEALGCGNPEGTFNFVNIDAFEVR